MSNQFQDFLRQDLIMELGLGSLSDEKKEELVLRIGGLVQQNIILRLMSEMPENDKDELEKKISEGDGEKTLEFLQSKVPNLNKIAEEEIARFKQEAVARMQAVIG